MWLQVWYPTLPLALRSMRRGVQGVGVAQDLTNNEASHRRFSFKRCSCIFHLNHPVAVTSTTLYYSLLLQPTVPLRSLLLMLLDVLAVTTKIPAIFRSSSAELIKSSPNRVCVIPLLAPPNTRPLHDDEGEGTMVRFRSKSRSKLLYVCS